MESRLKILVVSDVFFRFVVYEANVSILSHDGAKFFLVRKDNFDIDKSTSLCLQLFLMDRRISREYITSKEWMKNERRGVEI